MLRRLMLIWALLALAGPLSAADAGAPAGAPEGFWYAPSEDGGPQLHLYFFWSKNCPHCKEAHPVLEAMNQRYDWLTVIPYEISEYSGNRKIYQEVAGFFGEEARSYPAFFFCNTMMIGFDEAGETGNYIEQRLLECRERLMAGEGLPEMVSPGKAAVSVFTGFDAEQMSLPVLTVVIAGLDAFNPCAFFVLLSLLSLMVHAKNRKRIFFIGGVFVLFSGLIYFLFMAAWLNLFLLVGALRWITLAAGLVAMFFALLNIKDYFIMGVGPSLSIPDKAKPGLFQRMRGLLQADNFWAMAVGTVVLAIAVNSYELLCTSGLPMVYTRLLTLEDLPAGMYYLYLAAYNVIYVIPLLVIVIGFAATLGTRKLQAREGRLLKLLSGLMMLGLGAVLVFAPDLLSQVSVAFGLIFAAVLVTGLAWGVERWLGTRHARNG